jgi:hypothetical protein
VVRRAFGFTEQQISEIAGFEMPEHIGEPGLRVDIEPRPGSTAPVICSRNPFANSISIRPGAGAPVGVGPAAIRTAAKLAASCDRRSSCRRHPYSWLAWSPACSATRKRWHRALGKRLPAAPSRRCSSALTFYRRVHLSRLAHVTIPMNSHVTHILRSWARRPSPGRYSTPTSPSTIVTESRDECR